MGCDDVAWAEPTTDNAVVLPAREAGALARVVGMLLRLRPPRLRDDERLLNERLLDERLLDEKLLLMFHLTFLVPFLFWNPILRPCLMPAILPLRLP